MSYFTKKEALQSYLNGLSTSDIAGDPIGVLNTCLRVMDWHLAKADVSALDLNAPIQLVLAAAQSNARENFSGMKVVVQSTGETVLITWQGIKHSLSNKAGIIDALASTCLDKLIEQSKYIELLPRKHNDKPDILATHLYGSQFQFDGETYSVGIIVREYRDGRRLYDHFELKKDPASISGRTSSFDGLPLPALAGSGFIIARNIDTANHMRFDSIDICANDTNLSPTLAQQEAGNYKKGRIVVSGLNIAIENPAGSTRSGIDSDGKAWQSTMTHHYGYVEGTLGLDGDEVDVFVKTGTTEDAATPIYVIDQVNEDGSMDEQKAIIGASSEDDAKEVYLSNYEAGWKGFGGIKKYSVDEFKDWVYQVKPIQGLDSMHSDMLASLNVRNDPIGALQACLEALDVQSEADELSDDPNSPNYRYKDTGYISGSRKELAASCIVEARKSGQRLRATDIDFNALEQNPRLAAELIVKNNLFGKTDWQRLQDSGMDPAAGFLIDKIYGSIGSEPTNALPEPTLRQLAGDFSELKKLAEVDRTSDDALAQTRKDYARGLETIRDRLEAKQTVAEVLDVLNEIKSELFGVQLNAEQADIVAVLYETYNAQKQALQSAETERGGILKTWQKLSHELSALQYERQKRVNRKWKPDPDLEAQYVELKPKADQANQDYVEYLKAHPEFEVKERKNGSRTQYANDLEWATSQTYAQIAALEKAAKLDNLLTNPVTRAWLSLGDRFLAVLNYRGYKGSNAFAGHVTNAKTGKIKDWSWSDKERATQPKDATKQEIGFQLRVADQFERKGGRQISVSGTKDLENVLGLRAVQSGNWVLKDPNSAKFHIEQTVAAMSDMSDILGIGTDLLGFGGRLSMAFGARGVGGKGAAAAHYEPVQRVINLTKMKGGGALGHEWFHAMDNVMPEMITGKAGTKSGFMTADPNLLPPGKLQDAIRQLSDAMFTGTVRAAEVMKYTGHDVQLAKHNIDGNTGYGFRPEPVRLIVSAGNAADAVIAIDNYYAGRTDKRALKNKKQWRVIAAAYYHQGSDLKKDESTQVKLNTGAFTSKFAAEAVRLDEGIKGKYWSQREEIAARAFQAYLEDSLVKADRQNDYLSIYADNKYHVDPLLGIEWKPYPEGDERGLINAAFDSLFSVIREEKIFENAVKNKALMDSIFGDSEDLPTATLFDAITDGVSTWSIVSSAPELIDDEHQKLYAIIRDDGAILADFYSFKDADVVLGLLRDLMIARAEGSQTIYDSWLSDGHFEFVELSKIKDRSMTKESKERTPNIKTPVLLQETVNGHYQLIAGIKRLKLAEEGGDDLVPAIILPAKEGYSDVIIKKALEDYTGTIEPMVLAADIEQLVTNSAEAALA